MVRLFQKIRQLQICFTKTIKHYLKCEHFQTKNSYNLKGHYHICENTYLARTAISHSNYFNKKQVGSKHSDLYFPFFFNLVSVIVVIDCEKIGISFSS